MRIVPDHTGQEGMDRGISANIGMIYGLTAHL
jgi:hypothetical protein